MYVCGSVYNSSYDRKEVFHLIERYVPFERIGCLTISFHCFPPPPNKYPFFVVVEIFYFNGNFLQDSVKFLDFCFDSLYWGSSLPLACFFVLFLFLIVGCLFVDVLFSFHLNFILFFRLLFALHSCVIMSFTSVRFFF